MKENITKLRIGTYNIRNTTDYYYKRLPLIRRTLSWMKCDIIALQEVSFLKGNTSQINDLNEDNEYCAFYSSNQINPRDIFKSPDPDCNIDGNAILVKKTILNYCFELLKSNNVELNIEGDYKININSNNNEEKQSNTDNNNHIGSNNDTYFDDKYKANHFYYNFHFEDKLLNKTLFISPIKNAQLLRFDLTSLGLKDIKLNIINTHLHSLVDEELVRVNQIKMIIKWLEHFSNERDITILLGDFNALPNSNTYKYIVEDNDFISCHNYIYSKEPEKTFHNKMDAPYKDDAEETTFDYIL